MDNNNQIIIYQTDDDQTQIDVRLENETVWLTQAQMAELFQTDRTSIVRHINKIYADDELDRDSTCAKIAQVQKEGQRTVRRSIPYFNLDMIISVGYRVNSKDEITTSINLGSCNLRAQIFKIGMRSSRKREEKECLRYIEQFSEDNNYKNKALQTSLVNTINKNNKKAVEDFFKLYRADGIYCIQAYDKLSSYYKENNQTEKALFFSSLSVLTIFSRLYDYIEKRESDFKYTDFASFLKELTFHQDLLDWCDEMSFWKKLNEFSRIVAFSGNNEFSKSLLRILMKNIPVEYYQKEAVLLLEQSN